MAEVQHCRRVRHRVAVQLNAGKAAQRLAVINRIFERLIGQRVPLLKKVNAQHSLKADRPTPALPLWIVRLDHRHQLAPWHHLLHLCKKALPSRHLLLTSILGLCETHLLAHANYT